MIKDACLTHSDNRYQAFFDISAVRNPGYVITNEDFKLTFTDSGENLICSTSGGLAYTTTPGPITVGDWSVTNPLVSGLSTIIFTFQPEHPTLTEDI